MILKSTITVTYNDEALSPYTASMDWCEPAPGIIIEHCIGAGRTLPMAISDLAAAAGLYLLSASLEEEAQLA